MTEKVERLAGSGRPILVPKVDRPSESGPNPTFSLVVAAYQVASVIGETIESLLAQTLPAHEIIVCDDGSTDDIESALAPFAGSIVIVRKPHRGFASAMNAAIAVASGEFVVLIGADDIFFPERLQALSELALDRPDLGILTTDAYVEVDRQVIGRFYEGDNRFVLENQREAILSVNFIFGLAALRRRRVLDVGGFNESIISTSDWDLFIRMLLDGARAGLVAEPLASYRLREGSLTSKRTRMLQGRISTLEHTLEHPDLSDKERRIVLTAIAGQKREFALEDARVALVERRPDARRLARAILFGRNHKLRSRMKAALSLVAPRLAGHRVESVRASAQTDPTEKLRARE